MIAYEPLEFIVTPEITYMFSFLDLGEQSLWAQALTRQDDWVLCGPDKASLRFGIRLGLRERLVALEGLLQGVGYKAAGLRPAYTSAWLAKTLGEIVLWKVPKNHDLAPPITRRPVIDRQHIPPRSCRAWPAGCRSCTRALE